MSQFVRCRHEGHQGEAEIPAAAVEAMQAIGWQPISEARTLAEVADEQTVAAQQAAAKQVADAEVAEQTAGGTVAEILDQVGEDPGRAAAALAAERERPEDEQRKTLVEKLERIIQAGPAVGQDDEEEVTSRG